MIQSLRVINALLQTDRKDFCPTFPYEDAPQSIGYNATISAPHMHAFALEAALPFLSENGREHVLDVGAGSGFLSVAFANMLGHEAKVYGVEHIQELVDLSRVNTAKSNEHLLRDGRVYFICEDGRKGFRPGAPYDVIHVGAASEVIPAELADQLKVGGVIIIPVGGAHNFQQMKVLKRTFDGELVSVRGKERSVQDEQEESLVRYVPLTDRDSQLKE